MPPCDVFVHAGDITGRGSIEETSKFAARLRDEMSSPQGPRHAIIVPGNHDQCFELFPTPARVVWSERTRAPGSTARSRWRSLLRLSLDAAVYALALYGR